MKNRKIKSLTLTCLLSCILPAFMVNAQETHLISIKKFSAFPADISAQTNPVKDFNGKAGALLKILSPVNILEIQAVTIGAAKKEGKETWIILPAGCEMIDLGFSDADPIHISYKDF